ncbi:hypothetical protein K402DRAFT_399920 [Aulographum hederae CBS 113979]|uniref:Uncharacterized protein n=1 Tax=Aulographum hederae CBS 113979 TaxID=1176131 RepID=A0A6G1HGB4_9PEZI|nr:hypothetical protein K402DRAFT_399920 [Aulographum hederae CBS 113979]
MPIVTINALPTPLPFHRSRNRLCPTIYNPFPDLNTMLNPLTAPSRPALLRRLGALTILLLRTGYDLVSLYSLALLLPSNPFPFLVFSASAILGFCFCAWCLGILVRFRGSVMVLGYQVGRGAFDVVLGGLVVAHVGLVAGVLVGWLERGLGSSTAGVALVVFIWGSAWVASCQEERDDTVKRCLWEV